MRALTTIVDARLFRKDTYMYILSAKLTFNINHAQSLKEKRSVVKSLVDKTRHRYNLAIGEVDTQDQHQTLTLGIALVSQQYTSGQNRLERIIEYMQQEVNGELMVVIYNETNINDQDYDVIDGFDAS